MRKTRRLTREQLAPWVWDAPQPASKPSGKLEGVESAGGTSSICPTLPARINWAELFGNSNPVEIEVGIGKGLFLLNEATARPETNFLGIEIVRKYQLYAATRYAIRNLANVKTTCADAKLVLRDSVVSGTVAAVHVYFPDPWWKKRHKKRRVFTLEFAKEIERVLTKRGRLLIASDVEEYFRSMLATVAATAAFVEMPEEANRAATRGTGGFATNFERKALTSGGSVWRAAFQRAEADVMK